MNIRAYCRDDFDELLRLFDRAVHGLAAEHYDAAQRRAWAPADQDVAAWRARLQRLTTLVADDGGALAGFLSFEPSGYVDLLFVSPAHARRGVASRLHQQAEEQLRAAGATTITTHASLVARPFFERHGYAVLHGEEVERNGAMLRRLLMRKLLDAGHIASLPALRPPQLTRLADGRQLAWRDWGPPQGQPLLFCTGAASSSALGFGAQAADTLGVRIVAIDRPGLGHSSPHPDKSLASWVDDVSQLLRIEQLAPARALGFSQGSVFALALAAAGVVDGAALVSGQDELSHPAVRALLPADIADLVQQAQADPAAFEATLAGWADADGMWELVVRSSSPLDRALFTASPFAERYQLALREALAAGPDGYARDTRLAMQPWTFELAALPCPVALWYGALDTSPMHALDHGARLERRLPRARRHVVADAGSSLLWTHAADILTDLLRQPRPQP